MLWGNWQYLTIQDVRFSTIKRTKSLQNDSNFNSLIKKTPV